MSGVVKSSGDIAIITDPLDPEKQSKVDFKSDGVTYGQHVIAEIDNTAGNPVPVEITGSSLPPPASFPVPVFANTFRLRDGVPNLQLSAPGDPFTDVFVYNNQSKIQSFHAVFDSKEVEIRLEVDTIHETFLLDGRVLESYEVSNVLETTGGPAAFWDSNQNGLTFFLQYPIQCTSGFKIQARSTKNNPRTRCDYYKVGYTED